jgi:subtilisin family serine protease
VAIFLKGTFFIMAGFTSVGIIILSYFTFWYTPSIQAYGAGSASSIDVYVLDSGINFIEDNATDTELLASLDFTLDAGGENSLVDCLGHGTPVSNILIREAASLDVSINLTSLKVFGCSESVAESGVAIHTALLWVLETHDPNRRGVVNMSLNFGGVNAVPANYLIRKLNENNIIVVTSAGNNQSDACDFAPASLDSTIAVGNLWVKPSNGIGALTANSNFGDCVDIYSLGRFHCHTEPKIRQSCSGTSYAAPVISARVANMLQNNPKIGIDEIRELLVKDAVELNDNYLFISPSESTTSEALPIADFRN